MDVLSNVMDSKVWLMLVAMVPILFLVGVALESTATTCGVYEKPCTSNEAKDLKLSGNIMLLISASVIIVSFAYPLIVSSMGSGMSFLGYKRF